MIITDIKQLRDVPVGETATLVLQFKVVKADEESENPCEFCIFDDTSCLDCCRYDRLDKESVKFEKI